MRILVTGAAGDFGRDLVPWLAQRHEVRATDLRPATPPCEFVAADLSDPAQVDGLCEGVEAVIHLAALLPTAPHSTMDYLAGNTRAVHLLAEEALRAQVQRFVFVSTVWVAGHGEEGPPPIDETVAPQPVCLYGLTKYYGELAIEYYARNRGLSAVVLRACGYQRFAGCDAEGEVDWETVDLAALAGRLTSPGGKLFSPGDLGPVMAAAVSRPEVDFARCLLGLDMPLTAADAALGRTDPVAAWEKYYPGAAECFAGIGFTPPPLTYYYSNARSHVLLGFRQQITLADLISAWRLREGPR